MKKEELNTWLIRDYADIFATKAAPLFRLYGWTYGGKDVPSLDRIREAVEYLISSVLIERKKNVTVKSGRFAVEKSLVDGEIEINVSLELGTIYQDTIKLMKEER